MVLASPTFAISNLYRWDDRTRTFRWRDTGQLAPRRAIMAQTQRSLTEATEQLQRVGRRLIAGEIDLNRFHREASIALRNIHVQSAVLGAGGSDRITPETWLAIGRNVKKNIATGIGEEGDRFGLRELLKELRAGTVSEAQFLNRLSMYAGSGKESYHRANLDWERSQGKTYAIRQLGVAEHCPECIALAALPPQPIDEVVLPTQQCRCRTRCACSLQMLTLEEAVLRGARV